MPKPCVTGDGEPKDGSHPKWCIECRYLRMPAEQQLVYAKRRLAAVPEPRRKRTVPERHWPPGRRWCGGCQSFVRLSDLRGKKAKSSRCRACESEATRNSYVKGVYDITKAEEDAILAAQGGRCAICGRQSHTKRYAVDHDHRTLLVRGLLDPGEFGCNVMLGVIDTASKNDPVRALEIIDNLKRYYLKPPAHAVLTAMRGEPYVEKPVPF